MNADSNPTRTMLRKMTDWQMTWLFFGFRNQSS